MNRFTYFYDVGNKCYQTKKYTFVISLKSFFFYRWWNKNIQQNGEPYPKQKIVSPLSIQKQRPKSLFFWGLSIFQLNQSFINFERLIFWNKFPLILSSRFWYRKSQKIMSSFINKRQWVFSMFNSKAQPFFWCCKSFHLLIFWPNKGSNVTKKKR